MSTMNTPTAPLDADRVRGRVQDRYGALAARSTRPTSKPGPRP